MLLVGEKYERHFNQVESTLQIPHHFYQLSGRYRILLDCILLFRMIAKYFTQL